MEFEKSRNGHFQENRENHIESEYGGILFIPDLTVEEVCSRVQFYYSGF